VSKHPNLPEEY